MMGHELHRSGSFWSFLLSIDKDLADSARQQGCSCGGRRLLTGFGRIDRTKQLWLNRLRCRRTDARNAARGWYARAKTPTEKELCSPVQQCAFCGERRSDHAANEDP
jgi:hypothetical protein